MSVKEHHLRESHERQFDGQDDQGVVQTTCDKTSILEPERVVTHWRRFSMGLWRIPEGDISAAYSASTMPKVSAFVHEGRWFTNGGACHSGVAQTEVHAYPLIPADEYQGKASVPYSYEGREVTCKGKSFRLGAKVVFASSDPTVEEWRRLLRSLFADGGYFASGCEYPEFLAKRCKPESENHHHAIARELVDCNGGTVPRTKEALREWLDAGANPSSVPAQQLAFSL